MAAACIVTAFWLAGHEVGQSYGPAQDEWREAERAIKRLPPSAFPQLPPTMAKELAARRCTIPQVGQVKERHNVIRGQFAKKGQTDWAVLCSREGKSSLVIIWGGPNNCPAELALADDMNFLQGMGEGTIEFSRKIAPVDRAYILRHHEWCGGPEPPPIEHEGIDDAFLGKASVVHYCREGRWIELQGAD